MSKTTAADLIALRNVVLLRLAARGDMPLVYVWATAEPHITNMLRATDGYVARYARAGAPSDYLTLNQAGRELVQQLTGELTETERAVLRALADTPRTAGEVADMVTERLITRGYVAKGEVHYGLTALGETLEEAQTGE